MADKVVTYTEPTVAGMRSMVLNFDSSGVFLNITFDIDVVSSAADPSMQLGTRRMSGGTNTADLTAGIQTAITTLCNGAVAKFIADEAF